MSADDIVTAAEGFAAAGQVFAGGCSDMVRQAYAAGNITIPAAFDANAIMSNYPCMADPQPGDVAGWVAQPNGHVVIYVSPTCFVNCPGEGAATKINQNMGQPLTYVRPA
jgi:hypothetical protein